MYVHKYVGSYIEWTKVDNHIFDQTISRKSTLQNNLHQGASTQNKSLIKFLKCCINLIGTNKNEREMIQMHGPILLSATICFHCFSSIHCVLFMNCFIKCFLNYPWDAYIYTDIENQHKFIFVLTIIS